MEWPVALPCKYRNPPPPITNNYSRFKRNHFTDVTKVANASMTRAKEELEESISIDHDL